MTEFRRHYYHATIRRTVVALGSIFSDLKIREYASRPEDDEDIGVSSIGKTRYSKKNDRRPIKREEERRVDIEYGPKEKYISLLQERQNVEDVPNLPLPRMYFEVNNLNYDVGRKQATNLSYESIAELPSNNILESTDVYSNYVPVPYDANIELGLFTRSDDEAWQIIEQILPLFQPDYTVSLLMNNDTKEYRDVSYIYAGLSKTDTWTDEFDKTRAILYVLTFIAKTYVYGPIRRERIVLDTEINITGAY